MQRKVPIETALEAVSVIIVNYNAGALLVACVRSALESARQVILVDNASSDQSLKNLELSGLCDSKLKIVRNRINVGFASACNIGIQHCTESNILFLNPDCILGQNALQRMVQTLDTSPNVAMVGGLLLNPDGSEQGGGRRAVPTPWRSFVRAFGLTRYANRWPALFFDYHLHEQPLPELPIQVEAISGALMLVRRSAIDEIGIWDETYFLHCEDLDWCMRFRQKGWKILFEPRAPVIHIHGACSQSRPVFVEWHKHKGMVRFYRKFFQHQYPGGLMWLVVAGIWIRFALLATVKSFTKKGTISELSKKVSDYQQSQSQNESKAELENKSIMANAVAVVGATSMVGQLLLPQLIQSGRYVIAYSRNPKEQQVQSNHIEWREMSTLLKEENDESIIDWIWLAPIRILPVHLDFMRQAGAMNVVAVSTTSRFTKFDSSSDAERLFVEQIIAAEDKLQKWAEQNQATWTVLRPTLIYGLGLDKNISIIARFISRFKFFPILGKAVGLRQPIHVRDVASACKDAMESENAKNRAYNISGAEIISYREMVERIFAALGIRPRFFSIPLWLFGAGMRAVRVLPKYRTWSPAMVERMNLDMEFDHNDAARDLDFKPTKFILNREDVI
jgi:hypothetical protein